MALGTIHERRAEVKKLMQTVYTRNDMKVIASKFGCSYTAVYMDIIAMSRETKITAWPTPKTKKKVTFNTYKWVFIYLFRDKH